MHPALLEKARSKWIPGSVRDETANGPGMSKVVLLRCWCLFTAIPARL
jgi:hypothetical protein